MTIAYDYSARPIPATALLAAGVRTVMRYVSTPGNSKNITAAEYLELRAAGIEVGLVYETSATWMLGGYAAGQGAYRAARAQASAVGYPATQRIWFAADWDVRTGQLVDVLACLHGAAAAAGSKSLVSIYGGFAAVDAADGAGFDAPWQTEAWSGGRRSSHAVLYQRAQQATCDGVQVDVNDVLAELFPAPPAPAPTTAAAAAFLEETSMQIEPTAQHPGEYAMIVPPGVGQLVVAADGGTGPGAVLRVALWNNDKPTVLSNLAVGGASGHHVVAHPLAGATAVTVRRLDAETYPVAAGFRA